MQGPSLVGPGADVVLGRFALVSGIFFVLKCSASQRVETPVPPKPSPWTKQQLLSCSTFLPRATSWMAKFLGSETWTEPLRASKAKLRTEGSILPMLPLL